MGAGLTGPHPLERVRPVGGSGQAAHRAAAEYFGLTDMWLG
jgi:hypothetical protein